MRSTSKNSLKESLKQSFNQCRQGTLKFFENIDDVTFRAQPHPDFSPIGWHLGHIAYTEAYWLLEKCAGFAPLFPEYDQLFNANGLPKAERVNLPPLEVIYHYLATVRSQVNQYLENAPLEKQQRLWKFLLQHESQHSETIVFVLQLQKLITRNQSTHPHPNLTPPISELSPSPTMIQIPAGEFTMGSNAIDALDNEKPAHQHYLDTYSIGRYPVTCGQYREFIQAQGYQNPQWWSTQGWQWLQQKPVNQPLYWSNESIYNHHPVCGVSWYEAQAYCNFVGQRLPTEAEWEKAASWNSSTQTQHFYPWGEAEPSPELSNCDQVQLCTTPVNFYPDSVSPYGLYDTLGNVWEWTASWFNRYEGFQPYPYTGYSQIYFDGQHQVLKGGSCGTRSWAMRSSFRNWYHPHVRQIFAGFRCASN
ncbi:ergothioneine biosynthesis protein EgtB [Planktothrix paucivesiculata]|uniref:Ergothioneine biosynthesis protein EgtB n=1 Tax=Planktothrix paucivesiculata PCC 9631 TaxID=671071 RepID=A0A7Z9E3A6_9CYAN|nr:ergothioneine biosynthesis protein EgtB [Planktothrix paucivesiculata]VXD23184.1 conserved hypothetical protein [Planktothrix paucivesiculata PCC 9631]